MLNASDVAAARTRIARHVVLTGCPRSFAIGEAIAHMHRLMHDGRVERLERDDLYRFVQT